MDSISQPLYVAVAADMASLIAAGQLRPHDRVPSVRSLARQRGISVTTAVASLRHLEERGLIEARARSGYFVASPRELADEPVPVALPRTARLAGAQAMLRQLTDASLNPAVVRLGQAIPDAALFPRAALQRSLMRASRQTPTLVTAYALQTEGDAALRTAISRHYASVGARVDKRELLITNGCTEALSLALGAVARAGDVIAVESPTYFGFLQLAEMRGIRVLEVPSDPSEGIAIESLRALLAGPAGRSVRAVAAIPSFSNPTGASIPLNRRRELVRLCDSADVALIEDDVYGDLQHEGARIPPCKAFDREGRVILCGSYTKSMAPGLRIGFTAAGRYRDAMRAAKHITAGASAPLPQAAIADFMAGGRYERHLRKLRAAFARQVAQVSHCVQREFPVGTRISRPKGSFILWVELPGDIDTLALYEEANRYGVDFVPGSLFSASGRYRNCLRLNCGYPVTLQTEGALRRLGELIRTRS